MKTFTFTFKGTAYQGNYCPSTRGKGWIKVIFFGHSAIIHAESFCLNDNKKTWVQNIQQGESIWPHELIQIMGESIEPVLFSENFRTATKS